MEPQSIPQIKSRYKVLIYISKPTREKGRDRVKLTAIPEEASRRFFTEEDSELLTIVRKKDPIELPIPFHIVSILKRQVFKEGMDEEGLKAEIGFLGYEYLNPILHVLGLGSITVKHYQVEKMSITREKVKIGEGIEVDKVSIEATGFTLYPLESTTKNIRFSAVLYNLDDHFDYGTHSNAVFIIDLYGLMKELKIRWDIDFRY